MGVRVFAIEGADVFGAPLADYAPHTQLAFEGLR